MKCILQVYQTKTGITTHVVDDVINVGEGKRVLICPFVDLLIVLTKTPCCSFWSENTWGRIRRGRVSDVSFVELLDDLSVGGASRVQRIMRAQNVVELLEVNIVY
jgi:hypothetical protein